MCNLDWTARRRRTNSNSNLLARAPSQLPPPSLLSLGRKNLLVEFDARHSQCAHRKRHRVRVNVATLECNARPDGDGDTVVDSGHGQIASRERGVPNV